MARLSINPTKKEYLQSLYKHLSIQSILDIKAVNGEVTESVLHNLLNMSSSSWTVFYGDRLAYTGFIMTSDIEECSVFVVSTSLGYSDKDAMQKSFSGIIKDLPNYNFYSIVYKGNHQYAKLLKDNGFTFIRDLVHGVEKRSFLLLGKLKNE